MLRILLLALVSGCGLHRSYHPEPLSEPKGAVRHVDGVDVGLSLRFIGSHDGAPMLIVSLRNAGTRSVAFDLARARIRGYAGKGSRGLQLDDPRGEVEPLHIDPGASGREKIRLTDVGHADGELQRICVDLAPAFSESNADVAPVCFVPTDDVSWAVSP